MAVPSSGFSLIDVCNEIYGHSTHTGRTLKECFASATGIFTVSGRDSLLDFAGYNHTVFTIIPNIQHIIRDVNGGIAYVSFSGQLNPVTVVDFEDPKRAFINYSVESTRIVLEFDGNGYTTMKREGYITLRDAAGTTLRAYWNY